MVVDYAHKPDAVDGGPRSAAAAHRRPADRGARRRRRARPRQAPDHGRDRRPAGRRPRRHRRQPARRGPGRRSAPRSWPAPAPATAEVLEIGDRRAAIREAARPRAARRRRAGRRQGARDRPGGRRRRAPLRRPRGRPRGAGGPGGDRAMIAMTLAEIADVVGGRGRRRPAGHRDRAGVPRQPRARRGRAVRGDRGGARRRPRLRRGGRRGWRGRPCSARRPTAVPTVVVRRRRGRAGPAGAARGRRAAARRCSRSPARRARPAPRTTSPRCSPASGETVATAGNLNNELGVPLTVLRCTAETDYLVVEMGARGIGHIAELCRIAPPDVAAVLNVGTAHLGEFGSPRGDRPGQGRDRRGAARPTVRRSSTPTTTSSPRWASAPPRGS